MSDEDTDEDGTRLWLVDRQFRDENLITLVYATVDGERHVRKQLSYRLLQRRPATAAIDVPAGETEPTPGADAERYATQASEMAASHDPDEEV